MAAGFTIRAVEEGDQAFICEMQYQAFFVPPGAEPFPRSILDEPRIRRYYANFGAETGDVGFIAESSAPLGAAWARRMEGYGFVDHETPELGVAVVERARGTGIGTALLEHLLATIPRCSLSVDTRNPAMRLYERLGFATVRRDGDWTAVMLRSAT